MNFKEIKNAVNHLLKTCNCLQCNSKYKPEDIMIIATTNKEGLFEVKCEKCNSSTIVNVILSTKETEFTKTRIKKTYKTNTKISHNDILDIKNFLSNFDGNFKKIFSKE